jgi:hypothetical protein
MSDADVIDLVATNYMTMIRLWQEATDEENRSNDQQAAG